MTRIGSTLRPALIPILAVVTAFIVGSIFILITDFENLAKLGSDPAGALGGAVGTIGNAYYAMLVGALGDPARIAAALADPTPKALASAVRPITETLVSATPLIFCGPGGRDLLPERRVQHRRRGPVRPRRLRGRRGGDRGQGHPAVRHSSSLSGCSSAS